MTKSRYNYNKVKIKNSIKMFTRKTANLSQINLSYLEWNQGKEPVLLLHGLADHGLVWQSLGEELKENYHLVAPDLRGHGESEKPLTGYFSDNIIQDLEDLMNHLNWDCCHVIAHSWTGKLAPIWATKHPEKFKTMILVDPFYINKIPSFFKFTFPFFYKVLPFLKVTGTFKNYEEAENIARNLKQYQGWSDLQKNVFQESLEITEDGKVSSKFVLQARNEIFEDVMLKAGLTEILNIPTLFIKPAQGLNRSEFQLKPYKTYLKNLEIVEVAGNHWAFLVESQSFNTAVKKFLDNYNLAEGKINIPSPKE
jgi:pimeloyl-ACP methyl ester carboxylesterase